MSSCILITGGTGTLGTAIVEELLRREEVPSIRIYSRDEFKQSQMRKKLPANAPIRYLIGDVSDRDRLTRAMRDATHVIHCAALKQIASCEYNPIETVKTNIMGTINVIEAAIDVMQVEKVLVVSSDKAVQPINLYGATKMVAERIAVHSNAYRGSHYPWISSVRYGNVTGSRGAVHEVFKEQARLKMPLTITDPNMTRFWWYPHEAAKFVLKTIEFMEAGCIYVPKLRAESMGSIATKFASDSGCIRIKKHPYEKDHEDLIASCEVELTRDLGWSYCVYPNDERAAQSAGVPCPYLKYSSDLCVEGTEDAVC